MNSRMKSNGWILCPSKRLPGKFYYFNVTTGETAWSLNEAELLSLKKNSTESENEYCTEMNSPPDCPYKHIEKCMEINDTRAFKPIFKAPTHTFGQTIFPKPLQSCVLWAPEPEIKKEIEREMFIQTTDKLLGQRIINFEQPVLKFDEKNKIDMFRYDKPNIMAMSSNMTMSNKAFTNNIMVPNNTDLSNNMTMPNNMHIINKTSPNNIVTNYWNVPNTVSMTNVNMSKNMTMSNNVATNDSIDILNNNNISMFKNAAMLNSMTVPNNMILSNNAMSNDIATSNNMYMPKFKPMTSNMTMSNNIMTSSNDMAGSKNMTVTNNMVQPNHMTIQSNMAMPNNMPTSNDMAGSKNMTMPNNNMVMPNHITIPSNMTMSNNMPTSNDMAGSKNMIMPNNMTMLNNMDMPNNRFMSNMVISNDMDGSNNNSKDNMTFPNKMVILNMTMPNNIDMQNNRSIANNMATSNDMGGSNKINIPNHNMVMPNNMTMPNNITMPDNMSMSNNMATSSEMAGSNNFAKNMTMPNNIASSNNMDMRNNLSIANNVATSNDMAGSNNMVFPNNMTMPSNMAMPNNMSMSNTMATPSDVAISNNIAKNTIIPNKRFMSNMAISNNMASSNNMDMRNNKSISNNVNTSNDMAGSNNMVMPNNNTMPNNMAMPNNRSMSNNNMVTINDMASLNINTKNMTMANNMDIPNNRSMSSKMAISNDMAGSNNIAKNMFMTNEMTLPENMDIPNNMSMPNDMAGSNNIVNNMNRPNNMTVPNKIPTLNNISIPNGVAVPDGIEDKDINVYRFNVPNNISMQNNMTMSNNMTILNTMPNNGTKMVVSNNLFETSTPNKYYPFFPHDESSIDSLGISKLDINKKLPKPKAIILKARLNFTPNKPTFNQNSIQNPENPGEENLFKIPIKINHNKKESCQNETTDGVKSPNKLRVTFDNEKCAVSQTNKDENTLNISKKKDYKIPKIISKSKDENTLTIISNEKITPEDLNVGNTEKDFDKMTKTTKEEEKEKLQDGDLRLLLMSKRKKPVEIDEQNRTQGKKIKTSKVEPPPKTKKKVSFNLEPEYFDEDFPFGDENESELLKNPTNCDTYVPEPNNQKLWYIVLDTNVLLENYDYFDSFLKGDQNSRLLIPHKVLSEIQTLSKGESQENRLVTLARYRVRSLSVKTDNIIVKTSQQDNITTEDDIIKSCLDIIMNVKAKLTLITNDEKLKSKAKTLNIDSYNYQEFKNNNIKKPKVNFDIDKIKISVPNKLEKSTHAFRTKLFEDSIIIEDNNGNTDLENISSEENFEIQKDEAKNKMNEKISPYFENFESDSTLEIGNEINDSKIVSFYFQKTNSKKTSEKSIFETAKEKVAIPYESQSIFETAKENNQPPFELFDGDINLYGDITEVQMKRVSIFDIEDPMLPGDNNAIDNVEKFKMKTKLLEDSIESRQEEFLCHFRQLMEECLSFVLSKSSIQNDIKIWTLYESLQCISYLYKNNNMIVNISTFLLNNLYDIKEKVKKNLKATEVFKIIGYGLHLIKKLQKTTLNSIMLKETESYLVELINIVREPAVEFDVQPVKSVCRSELSLESNRRRNFMKDNTEILEYLKKHYPVWANYDENTDRQTHSMCNNFDTKILRTNGKNLGSLKINKSSMMTMNPINDNHLNGVHHLNEQDDNNKNDNYVSQNDTLLKPNDMKKSFINKINDNQGNTTEKNQEPKIVRVFKNKSLNELIKSKQEKSEIKTQNIIQETGPKVIRNVQKIEAFENKLNFDSLLEDDELNDSDDIPLHIDEDRDKNDNLNDNDSYATNTHSYAMSLDNCVNDLNKNDTQMKNNQEIRNNTVKNEEEMIGNDTKNDSGYGDDSQMYSTIKTFLFGLLNTFKMINDFIIRCKEELEDNKLNDKQKNLLHQKCCSAYREFKKVIENLHMILLRESSNSRETLKYVLKGSQETFLNNYRELVKECLEKSQLIEKALQTLLVKTEVQI